MIRALTSLHDTVFSGFERITVPVMTTLARFIFAAVLLGYYWNSGVTKLGDGILGFLFPGDGAYIQIFPRTIEENLGTEDVGRVNRLPRLFCRDAAEVDRRFCA